MATLIVGFHDPATWAIGDKGEVPLGIAATHLKDLPAVRQQHAHARAIHGLTGGVAEAHDFGGYLLNDFRLGAVTPCHRCEATAKQQEGRA